MEIEKMEKECSNTDIYRQLKENSFHRTVPMQAGVYAGLAKAIFSTSHLSTST